MKKPDLLCGHRYSYIPMCYCRVKVIFIDRDGDRMETTAIVGTSLLTTAIDNGVELEGICVPYSRYKGF